jgi:Transmembrane domain of unknown function (DUF3566)
VNAAEEDGVDDRAESLTHGETVLDDTPAETEDPDSSSLVEPTGGTTEAPPATPTKQASSSSAPNPTQSAGPAASPSTGAAYSGQNGSTATSKPAKPATAAANPPVSSLMAPPASQPGSNGSSIQDSAIAAIATAASGARGIASRVGASFASLTKPRPAPPKLTGRPQMPPRPPSQAPGPWPPQSQPGRAPGAPRPAAPPGPPARTALLSLQRIEPLSVMKFSSLLSLAGFVVLFVAVAIVWFMLNKLGVFTKIEQTIGLVTYSKSHPGANAAAWFSARRWLGYAALIGAINAILFTALSTIGAAIYNLITSLTGGIEVTLKETD